MASRSPTSDRQCPARIRALGDLWKPLLAARGASGLGHCSIATGDGACPCLRRRCAPMEARSVDVLPDGAGWQYEPKWDGFRCLAFRDGDVVELQSKAGAAARPLLPRCGGDAGRATPDALRARRRDRGPGRRAALLRRAAAAHPPGGEPGGEARRRAAGGVRRLRPAGRRPTAVAGSSAARARRRAPRGFCARAGRAATRPPVAATGDANEARAWLDRRADGLDGIVAKRSDLPYQTGERTGMVKMKRRRTVDCVVGGFRYGTDPGGRLAPARPLRRRRGAPPRRLHLRLPTAERPVRLASSSPCGSRPASPGARRAGRAAGAPSGPASGSRSRRAWWSR